MDIRDENKTKDEEDFLDKIFKEDSKKNRDTTSNEKNSNSISFNQIYSASEVKVTPQKIKLYLKNYNALDKLIKYREDMIIQGRGANLNEWKSDSKTRVDNQAIALITDYKLKEMKFYKINLINILKYLQKYIFIAYQFIYLHYFKQMPDNDVSKALKINDIKHFEDIIIQYIYEKLQGTFKNRITTNLKNGGK